MKKNIFSNKIYSNFLKYFVFFIIFFLIYSCNNKNNAFIFNNPDYFYVFDDEYKIYKHVKKNLNRKFYNVNEILIESFESLPEKISEILKNNKSGLFYVNDFLTPMLLKKVNIPENNKFKILTYNLQSIEYNNDNFNVFNVLFDTSILEKKIIDLIKNYSEKDDLSDCGLLINSNYTLPLELNSNFKKNNINLNSLDIKKSDDKIIFDWLKDKKMKVILLFGYDFNSFVLNIKENEYGNILFIEFLTNYGKISEIIKYKIDIFWDSIMATALESKEFKNFLGNETKLNNSMNNYTVSNNNFIYIEKYKKNNIQPE